MQKLILEVDNYNKKMMGVGMKEMTKSRDLFKNGSQELSDEMAKQVEEYTKSYIKKHDELYGEGSYEFLISAINYYMDNLEK